MRLAAFFLVIPALLVAETWTPEQSMKVQSIAEAVPSPDGKLVAWAQTRAVMDAEKSESLTHIFIANAGGSHRRQLTRGDKSANAAAFSPDSAWIFFLSDRSGKKNLFRIAVDGGEAEMLTDWKGVIGAFQISPDGRKVALTAVEENADEEKRKKEKRDFRVVDDSPKNMALWTVELTGEPPYKPKRIMQAKYHVGTFRWSPDSKSIAFEHRPSPAADEGRLADIAEVDLASGTVKDLAKGSTAETQPFYSPDGKFLAYVRGNGELRGEAVVLLDRQSGSARDLRKTLDEQPHLIGWTRDGILYSEQKGTKLALFTLPVDGPPKTTFVPATGTLSPAVQVNANGTLAAMAMQTVDEPVEAYAYPLSGSPVKVSAANTSIPRTDLGKTEVIQWKGKDGTPVEGLLTLPTNYKAGQRVPLVLVIHGGPAGAFGESFIGASGPYPIAVFAQKGYAVLRANIRGSVGYGQPFRAKNFTDWGGGDYQDLMTGVDSVIAKGIVDPERMAVMGWSYGGYMTSWVITQTSRFKAASIGAGLTNLVSMWGTNDIPSVLDDYFGGSPWEAPQAYAKSSPLNFVSNVKTPTLLLHGEVDPRVPISQAYEMYHSLKKRGVETQMVVYPRTEHGPREPKFIQDIMERNLAWVEAHIGQGAVKASR